MRLYRTLRSKRTKAQKLESDPPNVSISAKAIITWTVHRHVYFTAECWQSVGQSVGRSVSFQPLYRLTESHTLKSDAHLIIQKSYILLFQRNKNDSCVDPLDYMLLPTPPPMDEEGIWRLERKYSRGRGRGSYKAFMIWKVCATYRKKIKFCQALLVVRDDFFTVAKVLDFGNPCQPFSLNLSKKWQFIHY